jgi:hypothetical protein
MNDITQYSSNNDISIQGQNISLILSFILYKIINSDWKLLSGIAHTEEDFGMFALNNTVITLDCCK